MWPFRSYKRNRLINEFMLDSFQEHRIPDTFTHRLMFLEALKIDWEEMADADLRASAEYNRFMNALDEEIAVTLDRCITLSCPR